MSRLADAHEAHGATFVDRGGQRVVGDYGRPARTAKAVRRVVGAIETPTGVVSVTGADRHDFVDDAVTNEIPRADGTGAYALLLTPDGAVETDMYVFEADGRLLCFTPPSRAGWLAEEWASKTFVQDVAVADATDEFAVFGVHGPQSTEKIASVLTGAGSPEPRLSFVRGSIGDAGVTVVRTDDPVGEEGYQVVCAATDAAEVWDALLHHGNNATPFGYRTWETLTLEAGTPLYDTELAGEIPNVTGVRNALDFDKGCFVGQETVARVENVGRPSRRLVGLELPAVGEADPLPEEGADVRDPASGESVGTITRAAWSPHREAGIAFALVPYDSDVATVDVETVDVDSGDVDHPAGESQDGAGGMYRAERASLPFVASESPSARIPSYE
jgi:aminomethyltransferase